jgi:hypothetical protein
MEHADAIISDSFWFIISKVFLKKSADYSAHIEFYLDRLAANYVSFTLIDENDIPSKSVAATHKTNSFKKNNT